MNPLHLLCLADVPMNFKLRLQCHPTPTRLEASSFSSSSIILIPVIIHTRIFNSVFSACLPSRTQTP